MSSRETAGPRIHPCGATQGAQSNVGSGVLGLGQCRARAPTSTWPGHAMLSPEASERYRIVDKSPGVLNVFAVSPATVGSRYCAVHEQPRASVSVVDQSKGRPRGATLRGLGPDRRSGQPWCERYATDWCCVFANVRHSDTRLTYPEKAQFRNHLLHSRKLHT